MGNSGKNEAEEWKKKYPYNLLTQYIVEGNGITEASEYVIEEIPAKELLTPERIDLIAKWIYIDAKEQKIDPCNARMLYQAHIDAFSEGTFTEPGTEQKNTIEKYFEEFDELIEDIRDNGFDETKSLIPVGRNNVLMDGSHRCACAAYYDKTVKIIRFNEILKDYGTDFFKKRYLEKKYLDQLVVQYCNLHQNIYFACLWPVSDEGRRDDAVKIIEENGKIVYKCEQKMSYNALRNFMIQIYGHQAWVGTVENEHKGVDDKVKRCYGKKPLTIVIFQCDSLDKVVGTKEKIRNVFGISNDSIHISDNDEETRMMAGLLLNENSRHFLEYGKPDFCEKTNALIQDTRKSVDENISSGIMSFEGALSLYGIRRLEEHRQYYWTDSNEDYKQFHEKYGINLRDLIYNPQNYFCFYNLKVINLKNAYLMIRNGNEKLYKRNIREVQAKIRGRFACKECLVNLKNKIARYCEIHGFQTTKLANIVKQKLVSIMTKLHIYGLVKKIFFWKK